MRALQQRLLNGGGFIAACTGYDSVNVLDFL